MDAVPIPLMFAGMVVFVLLFLELGYRVGVAVHRRSAREKESPVSVISGAILGLAAFMLAFSFGIVSNRYDTKKELVREDANAIRTAWKRAEFLPEPDRAETMGLLRGYVDSRLAYSQRPDTDPRAIRAALEGARRVHDRLWAIAVAGAPRAERYFGTKRFHSSSPSPMTNTAAEAAATFRSTAKNSASRVERAGRAGAPFELAVVPSLAAIVIRSPQHGGNTTIHVRPERDSVVIIHQRGATASHQPVIASYSRRERQVGRMN